MNLLLEEIVHVQAPLQQGMRPEIHGEKSK